MNEPLGRWELLFADAEAQFEAMRREELVAETADRSRREFSVIALVDRLRAAVGEPLEFWLPEHEPIRGVLRQVGTDWILLAEAGHLEVLVPLAAVTGIGGLIQRTAAAGSEGAVAARLGLRHLLRRLARDRAPLRVLLRGGRIATGTCDRVGRDFFELAEHPPGEVRRAAAVHGVRSIPIAAVLAVRAG